MNRPTVRPGNLFVLARDVVGFPDFMPRKGVTRTVADITGAGMIVRQTDQHIPGCEQWDICIWCESGFLHDTVPFNPAAPKGHAL